MKISDNELIKLFLSNSLSENQRLLFFKRKEDPIFIEKLESSIIQYKGRLDLKKQLQDIGKTINTEYSTKHKKHPINYKIAASIVTIIGLSFYFYQNNNVSSQDLYNEYFTVYPNIYSTKGDSKSNEFNRALLEYDKGDYLSAQKIFKNMGKSKTLNSSEEFYYGISLLMIDSAKSSKKRLKSVSKSHPLYSEALWYMGLILVKQDSISLAKEILNKNGMRFSNARKKDIKKLLKKLE